MVLFLKTAKIMLTLSNTLLCVAYFVQLRIAKVNTKTPTTFSAPPRSGAMLIAYATNTPIVPACITPEKSL